MFVSTDVDALTIKNTNNQPFVLLKMCLFLGQNVIPTCGATILLGCNPNMDDYICMPLYFFRNPIIQMGIRIGVRVETIEVGPCGLNCHKPKSNSTRNIIPSAANFDIYIYIYI